MKTTPANDTKARLAPIKMALCSLFILLSMVNSTWASYIDKGDEVTIDRPVNKDCYLAGRIIRINANIGGDLSLAAQSVHVNNALSRSLQAAAEIVTVNAPVGHALRVFCRSFTLSADVDEDAIVFAQDVHIQEGVTISGDLIIYAANVTVDGHIGGNLRIHAEQATFNGKVDGAMLVKAQNFNFNGEVAGVSRLVAQNIEVGAEAKFMNDVRYWQADGELQVSPQQYEGELVFDPTLRPEEKPTIRPWVALLWFMFMYLVYGIIMILVLDLLFKQLFHRAGIYLEKELVKSFGYGILYIIITPIITIILFMTIIGIPLGMLVGAFFFFTLVTGIAIAALTIAYTIRDRYHKQWGRPGIIGVAIVVMLALKVLSMIPFVGFLLTLFLVSASFGSIMKSIKPKNDGEITVKTP